MHRYCLRALFAYDKLLAVFSSLRNKHKNYLMYIEVFFRGGVIPRKYILCRTI